MGKLALAITMVLVGCGKVPAADSLMDAAPPDDAMPPGDGTPPIDAPPFGPLDVTAQVQCCTGSDGVASVQVIATTATGTLRGREVTDAAGHARIDVMIGDSLTVVYPPDADKQHFIETVMNVEPGDHLVFGGFFPATGGLQGTLTVSWPPTSSVMNWWIVTPCSNVTNIVLDGMATGTQISVGNCPATFSVLLQGVNADRQTVAWNVLDNISVPGTAAFAALRSPVQFTVDLTVPAAINDFSIEPAPYLGSTGAAEIAAANAPGRLTATSLGARSPQGTLVRWIAFRPRSDGFGKQGGSDLLAASVARYQGPVATLPWVSQAAFDLAAHKLTWGESTGASYDAVLGLVSWSNLDDVYNWSITAPPGDGRAMRAGAADLPPLPADVAITFATDPTAYFTNVELVQNLDLEDSYRVARNTPEWNLRATSGAQRRMMTSDNP